MTKTHRSEPEAIQAAIMAADRAGRYNERLMQRLTSQHGQAAYDLFSLNAEATKARDRVGPSVPGAVRHTADRHEAARKVWRPLCEHFEWTIPHPDRHRKIIPMNMTEVVAAQLKIAPTEERTRINRAIQMLRGLSAMGGTARQEVPACASGPWWTAGAPGW